LAGLLPPHSFNTLKGKCDIKVHLGFWPLSRAMAIEEIFVGQKFGNNNICVIHWLRLVTFKIL
jgi:hypothetical protein